MPHGRFFELRKVIMSDPVRAERLRVATDRVVRLYDVYPLVHPKDDREGTRRDR